MSNDTEPTTDEEQADARVVLAARVLHVIFEHPTARGVVLACSSCMEGATVAADAYAVREAQS